MRFSEARGIELAESIGSLAFRLPIGENPAND